MGKCPDCGVPLDEIPFDNCRFHHAWEDDQRDAERRAMEARPLSQKIRESEDFEELRDVLATHFA